MDGEDERLWTDCPTCARPACVSWNQIGETVSCPACSQDFVLESVRSSSGSTSEQTQTLPAPSAPPLVFSDELAQFPQRRLDRYAMGDRIGEGAFGIVYKAYDQRLEREVAVKVSRRTVGKDAAAKFLKEARSVARLRHPNIVAVFDSGQSDEHAYIVYEYIPGMTLRQHIDVHGVQREEALEWIISLAEALDYAGTEGIVHRDIKPENIMIDSRSRPHIMDFGLASALRKDAGSAPRMIAGTPSYMSPEQAQGDVEIQPTSDQYSLAVVLYEILTGERLVRSKGRAALAEILDRQAPPTAELRQHVSGDLAAVCTKALAIDPDERYENCQEFADDLRAAWDGLPVSARRIGRSGRLLRWARRNRALAASLGAAVVLLLSTALVSTSAALVLAQNQSDLRAARENAEDAAERANEERVRAEEHRREAEAGRELAERSRQRAEAARRDAETAKRSAVESQKRAEEEAEKAMAALAAKDEAQQRQQLAERNERQSLSKLEHSERTQNYSQYLQRAYRAIQSSSPSEALRYLNECPEELRGWEWHWLRSANVPVGQVEGRPIDLSELPHELRRQLELPRALLSKLLVRPPRVAGKPYPVQWEQDLYAAQKSPKYLFSADKSFAIELRSVPEDRRKSAGPRPAHTEILLLKTDPKSGTYSSVPIASDLAPGAVASLISDDRYLAVSGTKVSSDESIVRVWELPNWRVPVLEQPIQSVGFVPSVCILSAPRLQVFANLQEDLLSGWTLEDRQVVGQWQLPSALAPGPGALRMLEDGRLVAIDDQYQFHYRDLKSASWSPGPEPLGQISGRLLWDRSGEYVAVFTLAQPPSNTAQYWSLFRAGTGEMLGRFETPSITPVGTPISIEELRIDGNIVAVRDVLGRIQGYERLVSQAAKVNSLVVDATVRAACQADDALVVAGEDEVLLVSSSERMHSRRLHARSISDVVHLVADAHFNRAAIVDGAGRVQVWNLSDGRQVFRRTVAGITAAGLARQGRYLIVGTDAGDVIGYDLDQEKLVYRFAAHNSSVAALAVSEPYGWLATAAADESLKIWDVETGLEQTRALVYLDDQPLQMLANPDDPILYVVGASGISIHRFEEGLLHEIGRAGLAQSAQHLALSDDKTRLAVAFAQTISLRDAVTGRQVFAFGRLPAEVVSLHFTSGNQLRAVLENGELVTWGQEINRPLQTQQPARIEPASGVNAAVAADAP